MYPQNDCLESDWKLLRKRIPVWQERYMGRLVQEYRAILDSEKLSSEKFWTLEKRPRQAIRLPGIIARMKKFNGGLADGSAAATPGRNRSPRLPSRLP